MFRLAYDDVSDLEFLFCQAEAELGIRSGQAAFEAQLVSGLIEHGGGAPPDLMPDRSERARRRAWRVHRSLQRVRAATDQGIAHVRILFWAYGPLRQPAKRTKLLARLRERFIGATHWEELLEIMEHAPMLQARRASRRRNGKRYELYDADLTTVVASRAWAQERLAAASEAYAQAAAVDRAELSPASARRKAFERECTAA